MKSFYHPTPETLVMLDGDWVCSYSGGKDSTTLVTWIEWMRRYGWVDVPSPRIIMSDTGVEIPFIFDIANKLLSLLEKFGWEVHRVVPNIKDKLYCQIFGRGVTPISLSAKGMRWCTRATKVKPISDYQETRFKGIKNLVGLRWGESKVRDDKMLGAGCSPGGECGVVRMGSMSLAPIINWTNCQVYDWLGGLVAVEGMDDVFKVTRQLLDVYRVKTVQTLDGESKEPSGLRFGCIGCPAVQKGAVFLATENEDSRFRYLRRLYGLWDWLRLPKNRATQVRRDKRFPHEDRVVFGSIKMAARKKGFNVLMEIQEKSGVTIVTDDDVKFIKECWDKKIYPRGWSEADEGTNNI